MGQSATLTCESDVSGTIEWLDSDMSVLATKNGSELDYTIPLVSDGIHGSTLICRTSGGEVSITLAVIGWFVCYCIIDQSCRERVHVLFYVYSTYLPLSAS